MGAPRKDTGYWVTKVFGKQHKVHRLIWFIVHGYWPNQIDHKDGNLSNNKLSNLRECSSQQNNENRKAKGYTWHKSANKWQAHIGLNGTVMYLGLYETEQEARAAYDTAKSRLHSFNPVGRL